MISAYRSKGPRLGEIVVLAAACLAFLVLPAGAADQGAVVAQGKQLFEEKCSGCHGVGTGDRASGPDLAGVTGQADPAWLARFIQEPDKVIASGDKTAAALVAKYHLSMPNLGLGGDQVEAVLAYLATTGSPPQAAPGAKPAQAPSTPAALPGDAARGEALFVGRVAMVNGGAPCLGCHALRGAGLGRAGGASYGPDLTDTYRNFGADGVASVLASLSFPSMEPIFAKRPLTKAEQADLAAFLAGVKEEPPRSSGVPLTRDVVVGTAIFFALVGLLGRRRLQGVRRPLLNKVHKEGGPRA